MTRSKRRSTQGAVQETPQKLWGTPSTTRATRASAETNYAGKSIPSVHELTVSAASPSDQPLDPKPQQITCGCVCKEAVAEINCLKAIVLNTSTKISRLERLLQEERKL